jgi:threonine aldolase
MARAASPIDLRSDTVTRPSEAMRRAMAAAPVGDDIYREDPTIEGLQHTVADLLGKEAALYVPSGTMSNQLCLRTHTRPGDEVIAHEDSHILHYEAGSAAALSGLQIRPLPGEGGVLSAQAVEQTIRPSSEHFAHTGALEMENTHNRCGGTIWPLADMQAASAVARTHGVAVHLDGARLWNAHMATGVSLKAYAATADSVSVCFSKGLGAPVGSALLGSKEFIEEARHNRKRYGGAMRQAGIIAAGALYALEHNLERLVEDHDNATVLASLLSEVPGLELTHQVQTNIVIVAVGGLGVGAERAVEALKDQGVLCGAAAADRVRFVTHLDVSAAEVRKAGEIAARTLVQLTKAGGPSAKGEKA